MILAPTSESHQHKDVTNITVTGFMSPKSVIKLNLYFSINLHAQVAVVTKAKLDAVSVKGDCKCD